MGGSGEALEKVPPHFWTFLKSAPHFGFWGAIGPPTFWQAVGGQCPPHLKNPKYTPAQKKFLGVSPHMEQS